MMAIAPILPPMFVTFQEIGFAVVFAANAVSAADFLMWLLQIASSIACCSQFSSAMAGPYPKA
jgi:hypothetical protein